MNKQQDRLQELDAYRAREARMLGRMLAHYCRSQHGSGAGRLCPQCAALRDYAFKRLAHCPFQGQKPVCSKCPVHCYSKPRRAEVQAVMRWAGPRLLWRHPLLALRHLLDKARPVPAQALPQKR